MICKTEGLVLRTYRMSESSKLAVVYTRERGKVRLVAKGARRPKSKFGASLEVLTWGAYVYYHRENRELQTLGEGDIRYAFEGLKRDYRRTVYASAICDLLDHMTVEEDRNALLFSVTLDALRWMEAVDGGAVELPLWYFQLKAASALGYRPHLSGCVRCGGRLSGGRVRFSPVQGGTLCAACGAGGLEVKMATVAYLERLQVGRPERIDTGGFQAVDRAEGHRMLRLFLDHHAAQPHRVKALDFLDRMLAAEGASPHRGGEVSC